MTKARTALLLLVIALAAFPLAALGQQPSAGEKRASPVSAGETAPDFTLEAQDGSRLTLSAQRGKRPVILVFYRGYW